MVQYIVQSEGSRHAAELLLERNGRCEALHVDLTVEMEIGKLALDGRHHGPARDTEIPGAEIGPFVPVLSGIAIALATCGKKAADEIGLAQKQIVVCHHNGPLHAWSEIAAVDAQPDLE